MKKNLISILLLTSICSYSQNLSENEIHTFYLSCLNDFLETPIILHKKDKKEFIIINNDNMNSPQKIAGKKIIWIYGKTEVNEPLKGKIEKHNGRSVITLSYKLIESKIVKVQVNQWYLTNLESESYMFNPIPESNSDYEKKQKEYVLKLNQNQWIIKN